MSDYNYRERCHCGASFAIAAPLGSLTLVTGAIHAFHSEHAACRGVTMLMDGPTQGDAKLKQDVESLHWAEQEADRIERDIARAGGEDAIEEDLSNRALGHHALRAPHWSCPFTGCACICPVCRPRVPFR